MQHNKYSKFDNSVSPNSNGSLQIELNIGYQEYFHILKEYFNIYSPIKCNHYQMKRINSYGSKREWKWKKTVKSESYMFEVGICKVAQLVNTFTGKPRGLSLIAGTPKVENKI